MNYKSLSKTSLLISGIGSILLGVFFVYFFQSTGISMYVSISLSVPIAILFIVFTLLLDIANMKRHSKILNSKEFNKLITYYRLTKENRGEYYGLKGYIQGRFVRIYFSSVIGKGGGVGIMIYYKQPLRFNGSIDFEYLDKINNSYKKTSTFGGISRVYDTSHIRIASDGLGYKDPNKLIDFIDESIRMLDKLKLDIISEDDIELLINNDKYNHMPFVETFKK